MATGNSQDISITASTNLSDEDIEKAVSDSAYQEELIQYYGLDREEEKLEV